MCAKRDHWLLVNGLRSQSRDCKPILSVLPFSVTFVKPTTEIILWILLFAHSSHLWVCLVCVYKVSLVRLFSKAFLLSLQLKFRFFDSHVTLFFFQTLFSYFLLLCSCVDQFLFYSVNQGLDHSLLLKSLSQYLSALLFVKVLTKVLLFSRQLSQWMSFSDICKYWTYFSVKV